MNLRIRVWFFEFVFGFLFDIFQFLFLFAEPVLGVGLVRSNSLPPPDILVCFCLTFDIVIGVVDLVGAKVLELVGGGGNLLAARRCCHHVCFYVRSFVSCSAQLSLFVWTMIRSDSAVSCERLLVSLWF